MELNSIIMKLQWTSAKGYKFDLPVVHSSCPWRVWLARRNRKVIRARLGTHGDEAHVAPLVFGYEGTLMVQML